jgi:16S rRNA (cytidine1402-2'-O)-methyltransferase
MTPSTGILHLVATPIGNLEDITLRALRILREADAIYAEDTRHTANLLNHHQIHKPLLSCHEHNERRREEEIAGRVEQGERIALVSDAGSPGISDPGFRIVRTCVERGLTVEAIPGPCALVAALSASGLPTHEFHFVGFLPVKSGACERRLRELSAVPGTLAFYESPHRLLRTLERLAAIFPDRRVVVARELTKKFEEFQRGTAANLLKHFQQHPPRGEIVLLVGGNQA